MKEVLKGLAVFSVVILALATLFAIIMSVVVLAYVVAGVPAKCAFVDCVTTPHGGSIIVENKK